jgi:hypothetical protein
MFRDAFRPARRRFWLCWAVLLAALITVAAVGTVAPARAASAPSGTSVSVSAMKGWQQAAVTLRKGESYTLSYVSGTWTVDYRNFAYVSPAGYSDSVDGQIYQLCKYDTQRNYAVLLGRVGASGAFFPIGSGGSFTAASSGPLYLRINDDDACLGDNAGSVTMYVAPVQQFAGASTTYAGYSIAAGPSGLFTYVTAQWVVPKVQCPSGLHYPRTAAWVGLWGNNASISAGTAWLPQIGTVSSCTLVGTTYVPFWEMETGSNVSNGGAVGYGAGPQTIGSMSVGAGDTMFGSVEYEGKSGNDLVFNVALFDETRGKPGAPDQFEMNVTTTSAVPLPQIMFQGGAVVEGNCQGLAPFSTVPFSEVQTATVPFPGIQAPKGVSLSQWILNGSGTTLAAPGPATGFPGGMRYTVTFRRGTPPPAC